MGRGVTTRVAGAPASFVEKWSSGITVSTSMTAFVFLRSVLVRSALRPSFYPGTDSRLEFAIGVECTTHAAFMQCMPTLFNGPCCTASNGSSNGIYQVLTTN